MIHYADKIIIHYVNVLCVVYRKKQIATTVVIATAVLIAITAVIVIK